MFKGMAYRKRQRLGLILFSTFLVGSSVALSLFALKDSIVFFYSPSDLKIHTIAEKQRVRLGGLVKEGSVRSSGQKIWFTVTDLREDVSVHYTGILPDLFREGQGVVAEGHFDASRTFVARDILAKHDENYMPAEVVDALKETNQWMPPDRVTTGASIR